MSPYRNPENGQWLQATNFSDLLELNIKFMRGEMSTTPYHRGPLDPETDTLIPSLLKLHENRVFTWDSQPYLQEIVPSQRSIGSKKMGTSKKAIVLQKFNEKQQRPFISFIMAEEDAPLKVFQALKKSPEVRVNAQKVFSADPVKGSFSSNLVVTRTRSSNNRVTLRFRKWKIWTTVDGKANLHEEDVFDLEAMKQASPWVFEVVAASWKDTNLAELILAAVIGAKK